MRTMIKLLYSLFVSTALVLCLPGLAALAADATEIILSQAILNAATPYWANGSATAQAQLSDWNAYFDTASATLILKDAQMQAFTPVTGYTTVAVAALEANGDLAIELTGTSTVTDDQLTVGAGMPFTTIGIFTTGALTVSGSGSLNVAMTKQHTFGVYAQGNLEWLSGSYHCEMTVEHAEAFGMTSHGDHFLIAGGGFVHPQYGV